MDLFDKLEESRTLVHSEREERTKLKFDLEKVKKKMRKSSRDKKIQCNWFKEMDGNTKFFYRLANASRNRNHINKIIWDGIETEDPDVIGQAFVQYYTGIYGFAPNPCR